MGWVAFIDESGDHGMAKIDPASPMFALTAAVYTTEVYTNEELPSIARSKFEFWGHEGVIFRTYDLKKKQGHFSICANKDTMKRVQAELCAMFGRSKVKIIAAVIDKVRHNQMYASPSNPYYLAVQFVLERIFMMTGPGTSIVFESRGPSEDEIVRGWAEGISAGNNFRHKAFGFKISFAKKQCNVGGLQVADLACQPIIHFVEHPESERPDWVAVRNRIRVSWLGKMEGYGLKVFPPQKAEGATVS
jgi:hypothetical protein